MMYDQEMLKIASHYAELFSGCTKVRVGAVIVKNDSVISLGTNRTFPSLCKTARGCLRVEKYGDNAKEHRRPSDCRAIHAEMDAISQHSGDIHGATIYVTRYPCEACARAIVAAGIRTVVYGRAQRASEETYRIFEDADINCIWLMSYKEEDVTT